MSASSDTLFNKAYGYKIIQDSAFQLYDNLKTRGLPFDDGTYGNQHIYLSASNLANWGQFIFNNLNINSITTPNSETMGGIKYQKNLNAVVKTGAFGGTYSKLIFLPEKQIVLAINSTVLNAFDIEKAFNPLIKYLQQTN